MPQSAGSGRLFLLPSNIKKQEVRTRMTYDTFLEQMKKDLASDFATVLPEKYSGVQIGIRDVEKL